MQISHGPSFSRTQQISPQFAQLSLVVLHHCCLSSLQGNYLIDLKHAAPLPSMLPPSVFQQ